MLKAVLFDMDGVIVDSEPEYCRVEMKIADQFNIPFSIEEQESYKGINPITMWEKLVSKHDLPYTAEMLYQTEKNEMANYYKSGDIHAIPSTIELIKMLKSSGILLAVCSSSEKNNVINTLKRLNVISDINVVVTYNDVYKSKPHPEIFLTAAEKLTVSPLECIVVEDSLNGIIAAKAAGMKVIKYDSSPCKALYEDEADYIIKDMREISIELLEKLL